MSLPNLRAVCALVVLVSAAFPGRHASGAEPQKPAVRTVEIRPGNIFFEDEPVKISIKETGTAVDWRVTDFWGIEVGKGSAPLNAGVTDLTLPDLPLGWFDVSLTVHRDEKTTLTGSTRITRFTRFDLSAVKESPFGVMTHFAAAWSPDLIPVLAAAGIKNVRDEVFWAGVEKERGKFVFPTQFDTYMRILSEHHQTVLTPLSFGNRLYDDAADAPSYGIAPHTPEGIAAFGRYGEAVLQHYGKQIPAVEVWNEFNGSFGKGPADGRAEAYARILNPTYDTIKKLRPDVTVLGCATIGIPTGWIEEVFKNGGLQHMDAVSVHPYGYLFTPEIHIAKLAALREVMRKYNNGKEKPIWATEQGYFTSKPGELGNRNPITEQVQAKYLVRVNAIFLANNVAKTFWYLARDDKAFATMGLVGRPDDPNGKYAPKPAFAAYGVLTRMLTGSKFSDRDDTAPDVFSYHFSGGDEDVRVLWAVKNPQTVALKTTKPVLLTDLMGVRKTLKPKKGRVTIELTDAPVYATGAISGVQVVSARPDWTAPRPPVETPDQWVTIDPMPRFSSKTQLEAVIRNASPDQKAVVRFKSGSIGEQQIARTECDEEVAPASEASIIIPIEAVKPFHIYPAKVEASIQDGTQLSASGTVSYNPVPKQTVTVDGDLSDWKNADGINLAEGNYVKLMRERAGDADLSGDIRFAWDDGFLYIAARITDDVFYQQHTGYSTWKGDNIQFGFSADKPWRDGDWDTPWLEIQLALTPNGPEVFCSQGPGATTYAKGAKLAVKREGTVTIYECALPWKALAPITPAKGSFSMGLYVNDSDGGTAGRKGFLQWADIKRLDKMQPLILEK
ncbi:MAG TPA: sugar-binding protein [Chthoniobacterales bacterium]